MRFEVANDSSASIYQKEIRSRV